MILIFTKCRVSLNSVCHILFYFGSAPDIPLFSLLRHLTVKGKTGSRTNNKGGLHGRYLSLAM